jgi:hypothetical protein
MGQIRNLILATRTIEGRGRFGTVASYDGQGVP